tara:strand:+ start:3143 stop:3337 length:195 start_codon:yes stop_codon:yes gene_type:complete
MNSHIKQLSTAAVMHDASSDLLDVIQSDPTLKDCIPLSQGIEELCDSLLVNLQLDYFHGKAKAS